MMFDGIFIVKKNNLAFLYHQEFKNICWITLLIALENEELHKKLE